MDAHLRSQRARIGALALHAQHDPRETTKPGRAAFDRRFAIEVDPNNELPEDERLRRASYARKLYFAQLAYRSARVRALRKAQKNPTVEIVTTDPTDAPKVGSP